MIKEFNIENFRGHKRLEMKGITPLTIVSGTNNVGKSSLLEAFFLFQDHSSPDVFAKIVSWRGAVEASVTQNWEALFYQMNIDNELHLSMVEDDGVEGELTYSKDLDFAPVITAPMETSIGQMGTPIKIPYLIQYDYSRGTYREHGTYKYNGIGIYTNVETSLENNEREPMPWMLYVAPNFPRSAQDVMEWVGNLEIKGKKQIVIEALRLMDPDTEDLFSASQNGLTQLYIKTSRGVLPLKYAGDGMVRLLYIISAVLANENSLILIDEIENGFHYSMYAKLWEVMAKVAKDNSAQIIATSHSYEHISESLVGVKKAGREEMFSLHRLERDGENTKDNCYTYEMAKTAVDAMMEVR